MYQTLVGLLSTQQPPWRCVCRVTCCEYLRVGLQQGQQADPKLRYGVSRVYVQQCGYVLSDAENAFHSMHKVLQAVKDAALDPEAGKSK